METPTLRLNPSRLLSLVALSGLLYVLILLLWGHRALADGPSLDGVGGMAIVYSPHDGYAYVMNSNDTVSVVDGTQVVNTIDLPTGAYARLTDLAVAPNGDVYVSQWFYDRVLVLRDGQVHAIVPRQDDGRPGANGVENGPAVVVTNPANDLIYVATSWIGEPGSNGVTVISGTQVIAQVPTGLYPQAVGVNSNSGWVYVANALSNTVTVISGTVAVEHIPVGDYPAALGVDSVHGLVYVANRASGTVSVIDETTATATISAGIGPMAMHVDSQAGRAYVVNHDDETVAIVDGLALTRTATVSLAGNPIAMTRDPASGLLYVANHMSDTVSIIQNGVVTATLPVGRGPVAMAWDPGDGLYVVNFRDATLSLITGTEVVATIEGLPRLAHTSIESLPNGHAVVADLTGRRTWFLDGTSVVTSVATLDYPSSVWDTPARAPLYDHLLVVHESVAVDDQGRVFVADHEEESVSVITEDEGRRQVVWAYGKPYDLEAMPDSGRVYAAVGEGVTLFEGDPDVLSSLLDTTYLTGARALGAWPEMDRLYVARNLPGNAGAVSIIDNANLTVTHVINVCDGPAAMDIDRDRGLVYVTCGGSNSVGVISGTTWLGEVSVGQFPQGVVVNPVNGYAYIAAMLADHVAVLDGTELLATVSVPRMPIVVDVDPTTGRVFVTGEIGDAVAVISGTKLLTTVPTGQYPNALLAVTDTLYVGNAHSADVDIFRFEEIATDPGDDWPDASTILPSTAYAASIEDEEDMDWYKVPIQEPGSAISVTLGGLPADYDLAFFSPLTFTEEITATIETLDLSQVLVDGQLEAPGGWVDLTKLRATYRAGGARGTSDNDLLSVETLSDKIWESGDYYIAVWGHNGAHSDQSYVLRTEVSTPTDVISPAHPITPTSVPPPVDDSVRVLIMTHRGRLQDRYGVTRTAVLTSHLVTLAQAVTGTVVYLEDHGDAVEAYAQWDSQPENPRAANFVADIIKHMLKGMLTVSYPNVEYIVLVGNDNIVPFRRVPDLTIIANDRHYNAWVQGGSPMATRIRGGYLLSDDFYASYHPLRRGRELYIPEYATGRLVETPEEMVAAIDAYLALGPSATATTALVTGYDFLIDEAREISQTLGKSGITVTYLITDGWTADQLRPLLLDSDYGLLSLNGHFNHRLLVAGDASTVISRTEIVSAAADYTNDLVFSIGCQSGLNVPDEDALGGEIARTLDFAQAFLQRGAAYIGNTGYGYGDSDTIGYSEVLALKLSQQLANLDGPMPIGLALMRAKQAYYADVGYASFGDYDEKVLIEWTLYGLPMLRIEMGQKPEENPCHQVGVSPPAGNGFYATQSITISDIAFQLVTSTRTIAGSPTFVGNYYQVCDDAQVNPGRPVQPRVSVDLRTALPAGQVVHGALFVGGGYTDAVDFNPVVSRIVSDTAATEPPFGFERWYPSPMHVVNRLQLGRGALSEKLVVMPAQYLAASEITGTERLYTELHYDVHYTATGAIDDFLPPAIWRVEAITSGQTISFRVRVTDPSGVDRVVVAYDDGAGEWHTFDLNRLGGNHWGKEIALSMAHCFVQAVDKAGNVALSDNKGINFTVVGLSLGPSRSGEVKPGVSETYYHTLTNRGAGKDTFVLVLDSYPSWLVELDPSMVILEPTASTNVTVTVTTPRVALSGTKHVVTVTAISLSNQDVSAVVTDTTRVGQVAGVTLAPHREGHSMSGSLITYIHTLTNKGNGRDTFTLAASGESQVNPPTATLGVGEATAITVTVTAPYVLSGTAVSTAITATSRFDPGVYDTVTDTTIVSQMFGVALSRGLSAGRQPGENVTFNHTITNTGNVSDTFVVEVASSEDWSVSVLAGEHPTGTVCLPLRLDMGMTATLQISTTVPTGVLSGTVTTAVVTATSQASSTVQAIVTDVVTALFDGAAPTLVPERSGAALPGRTAIYTHTLTNNANADQTFVLEAASSEGYAVTVVPTTTSLLTAFGDATVIAVTVQTPADAISGTMDHTTVTATSSLDSTVYAVIIDTTTVSRTVGVALSPGLSDSALPGEDVTFAHTITNSGNYTDAFNLSVVSALGWRTSAPATVPIGPGYTATFPLVVAVPATVTANTTDTIAVGIASTFDPGVAVMITDTIIVLSERVYLPIVLRNR